MKSPSSIKKVTANLDVLSFPSPIEAPSQADCLNCSEPLELLQPDLDSPERLLGICSRCKHWFLLDIIPDEGEGIISKLPDVQIIRNLSREDEDKGISVMGSEPARDLVERPKPD